MPRSGLVWALLPIAAVLLSPVAGTEEPPTVRSTSRQCDDLVIGVPRDIAGGVAEAGAVNVIFGVFGTGLTDVGNVLLSKDDFGVSDLPGTGDFFGFELAAGDFDHDYIVDLVIGVPGDTVGGDADAGSINLYRGWTWGLGPWAHWDQDAGSITCCAADFEDFFGKALAVGDFDGDDYDDLAVGAWGEGLGGCSEKCGLVNIFYGGQTGLAASGQWWVQGKDGLAGTPEPWDRFGFALAAGDFDNDGYADLAIGTPGENSNAGVVQVLYGSAEGPTSAYADVWDQTHFGGVRLANEYFGWSLTVGDFNGDRHDDLAISSPWETVPTAGGDAGSAGIVQVLYGSASGLTAAGNQTWSQESDGVGGTAESGDRFGYRLAAGDFDGDGRDDLVIGVPYEDHNNPGETLVAAGLVQVLYGSASGITATGDDYWHQDAGTIIDAAGPNERFGYALAAGDLDCDGYEDLAIGVPGEEFVGSTSSHEGSVNVLYGTPDGLDDDGNQYWHQLLPWVEGEATDGEELGSALVTTRRPLLFGDGFEPGSTARWSEAVS